MISINIANIIGKGYKKIWNSKERYVVIKGSRASKKSKTTALWFIYNIMKYREANALVVRQFFNTLQDSCYKELLWAIDKLHVKHLWKCTVSPLKMTYLPTNQVILFRGFDNPESITSITVETGTLCWCWLEECSQLKTEDAFNKLDLSLRGKLPNGYFRQFRLTMNPWSDRHWIKKRFFDSNDENVLAVTTNYTCNEFLDETDYELFEKMKANNPRRYKIEGLGDWGVSEGLIYTNWEEIEFDHMEIARKQNIVSIVGADFGFVDPSTVCAILLDREAKEIWIYDEIYKAGLTNADFYKEIERKNLTKQRIIADSAEPKSIEELKRLGCRKIEAAIKGPDSVLYGIQLVQDFKIYIHPRCVNTVTEISNYAWIKKDDVMINKPDHDYSHIMDALRYAVSTAIKGSKIKVHKNFL